MRGSGRWSRSSQASRSRDKLRPVAKRLILLMLALSACDSRAEQEPAPANAALAAQPVRDEHRGLQLAPQWLAGRWQTGEGECGAGDTFFTLAPDGAYAFMQEAGRWSLAGDALTITVTQPGEDGGGQAGDRHTSRVTIIGPNEAEFRAEGGQPIRVFRCTN